MRRIQTILIAAASALMPISTGLASPHTTGIPRTPRTQILLSMTAASSEEELLQCGIQASRCIQQCSRLHCAGPGASAHVCDHVRLVCPADRDPKCRAAANACEETMSAPYSDCARPEIRDCRAECYVAHRHCARDINSTDRETD
jgi:hypothetical protein